MKIRSLVLFLSVLLPAYIVPITAQNMQSGIGPTMPSASAASYYYISKPGELTMQVNVWGSVKNPGRYEVPSSTDLVQLVSYAGGPTTEADLGEVRIVRGSRKTPTEDKDQITVDLGNLSSIDDSRLILYPGDTIFIDRSGWSSFRDALTIVTTAALLTTAVANIIIAERR